MTNASHPMLPRRIELLLPTLGIGGMEVMAAALATGLQARDWEVGVTCTSSVGELGGKLRASNIPVRLIPAPGLRSMVHAADLVNHFRARRPDVVMTHSGVWLRGARAARTARVPVIIHAIHGLFPREPWHGPIEKWLAFRHTDRVIAVSPSLKTYLRRTVRIPEPAIEVIPNGVDTTRFHPGRNRGPIRAQLGAGPDTIVIGCVARLDPVKNLPLLLRATARLATVAPNLRLLLVGDGPARAELSALATTLGIQDLLHFTGAVSDPESWYSAMDLFVLPSLIEAAPMSLLEAMASGCCVVATDVGANRETLANGSAGVVVPAGDFEALLATLTRLSQDHPYRHGLAAAARSRVEQHFGVSVMLDRYEQLFLAEIGAADPHSASGPPTR